MADAETKAAVEAVTFQVAKLALRPGDVLLVKVPKAMERTAVWNQVNDHLARTFQGNKVLLASEDIEFSVIQAAAAAA